MPTQASTLSKQYPYPPNPEVHVSQTMVMVYQDNILLQETLRQTWMM